MGNIFFQWFVMVFFSGLLFQFDHHQYIWLISTMNDSICFVSFHLHHHYFFFFMNPHSGFIFLFYYQESILILYRTLQINSGCLCVTFKFLLLLLLVLFCLWLAILCVHWIFELFVRLSSPPPPTMTTTIISSSFVSRKPFKRLDSLDNFFSSFFLVRQSVSQSVNRPTSQSHCGTNIMCAANILGLYLRP